MNRYKFFSGNCKRLVSGNFIFWLILALVLKLDLRASGAEWPVIGFTQVGTNLFPSPTCITHAGDGSQRLFVTEQAGRIRIIQNGNVIPQPFLNITDRVLNTGAEQGLLGLAFPPGFATNNHFYVYYTRKPDGWIVLSRFQVSPNANVADTRSEQVVMVIPKSFIIHNGGQIAFGPDGYLYAGVGDGGPEGDTQTNGQKTSTLLGKLLRIDVESGASPYAIPPGNPFVGNTNYLPEIWALGLRNPWRFSFDRVTGDLYLGDVGQNRFEEINFQPAGSSGGQNYGWRIMEGATNYNVPAGFTNFSDLTLPVASYDHLSLQTDVAGSVTGGYVYHGPSEPRMDGIYFYGDFSAGWVWGMKRVGTNWETQVLYTSPNPPAHIWISTFGEDEQGRLFMADWSTGKIYQVQDTHQAWTPTFSPNGRINSNPNTGIINSNLVAVTCLTSNAVIHYTTNGMVPTESDPIVPPSGLIQVSNGFTNKARAFHPDFLPSETSSAVYSLKVGTPIYTPRGGAVTNKTQISITSITPGAKIYYTTNAAFPPPNPTTNSLLYSGPLTFNGNFQIRAIAVASGFADSAITNASYTLAQVATPAFTPASAPITNGTPISITCATSNAVIYYTVDGSTPTTNSPVYASPFTINGGVTVKAFAIASGYANSAVNSVFFSLVQTATPIFNPASGPITNGTSISITCDTPEATIYYTLDDTSPTTNSPIYTGPIPINGGTTVKAFAVASEHLDSSIQSVFFSLVQTAIPVFSPSAGPISNGTSLSINCATPGAIIHYTVDGSTPTTNSQVYTGPLIINGGTTVSAFAVAVEHLDSEVQTTFYPLVQTATPIFNPPPGALPHGSSVAISCATPGAIIHYTLDGTAPTVDSQVYTSPLTISQDVTISALAVASEHLDSAVQSASYTLTKANIPVFTPSQGPLTNGALITISCSTPNAIIYYSTNGTTPDTNSAVYAAPILFNSPMTLMARSYASTFDPSDVQSTFFSMSDYEKTVVTTFAGRLSHGLSNAVGTLAQFSAPQGICIDKLGNFYVADTWNHVIRKISPSGQVSTFAGTGAIGSQNGSALNAQFTNPTGVCIDGIGNLYVSENCNDVRKIDTNGVVTTLPNVVNSVCGIGQIEVDPAGNLYAGSWATVRKISPDGTVVKLSGSGGNGFQGWGDYVGVGIDTLSNTYAATLFHVWKIAPDGATELLAGSTANSYYTAGYSDGPGLLSLFRASHDAAVDSANNIFVSDYGRIRKIRPDGWVSTLAGTGVPAFVNGPASMAQFGDVYGLCVDTNGNVYVADTGNNCIRKISPDTAGIGIADDWQRRYFGNVGIDPNGDPDHDGMNNYSEFWAGTDPLDANSVLAIQTTSLVNNNQIRIRWQTVIGKYYTIQYSSNLISWNNLGDQILGDGTIVSITDTDSMSFFGKRYYRIRISAF